MAGAGIASFGGGFGKALAAVLLQHRETQRDDANRAESRKMQGHLAALPVYLQQAQETGDYSAVEEVLGQINPDIVKKFKKEGSPFQTLGPLLSNPELMGKSVATPPAGTTSQAFEQEPPAPLTPTRVAGVPPPQPKTFLGMPVLTPEQRQERADDSSDPATRMRLAQRYAKTNNIPLEEAMDRFGLREFAGSASTIRYGGTVGGGDLPDGTVDSFGRPIEKDGFYRVENLPNGTKQFVPTTTPGMVSGGTEMERAAIAMGFRRFADVPPDQRAAVEAKAKEMSASFAGGTAKARVEGTGAGNMNVPADIKDAQATGVPVGTTAAEVAGQAVPTQAINERRRSVETLRASLQEMIDDASYLSPLPKKGELGDLLPGAAFALRKRNPAYREAIAKLEAKVNNIVNVMARSVGEQRGTQTEKDAERAEAAIVQLRDAFTTGDTQESAKARITESLKTLDLLLKKLPAPPTPKKGSAGAPASGGGMTIGPDGKLYINGQLMPGQK